MVEKGERLKLGTGRCVCFGLALIQLPLALWMYHCLPRVPAAPHAVHTGHRVLGWVAFLLSLSIAYHCVSTYGRGDHQHAGLPALHCQLPLYGAFVAKVLVVRNHRLPGWMLPVIGSALVCAIGPLWYSGAPWALNGFDAPGL
ncbi:DUF6529 family protein [Streptomyces sp. NPDC055140]